LKSFVVFHNDDDNTYFLSTKHSQSFSREYYNNNYVPVTYNVYENFLELFKTHLADKTEILNPDRYYQPMVSELM